MIKCEIQSWSVCHLCSFCPLSILAFLECWCTRRPTFWTSYPLKVAFGICKAWDVPVFQPEPMSGRVVSPLAFLLTASFWRKDLLPPKWKQSATPVKDFLIQLRFVLLMMDMVMIKKSNKRLWILSCNVGILGVHTSYYTRKVGELVVASTTI